MGIADWGIGDRGLRTGDWGLGTGILERASRVGERGGGRWGQVRFRPWGPARVAAGSRRNWTFLLVPAGPSLDIGRLRVRITVAQAARGLRRCATRGVGTVSRARAKSELAFVSWPSRRAGLVGRRVLAYTRGCEQPPDGLLRYTLGSLHGTWIRTIPTPRRSAARDPQ